MPALSPNQLIAYAFSIGKIDAQAQVHRETAPTAPGQPDREDAIDDVLEALGGDETEPVPIADLIAAYERGWEEGKLLRD